MYALKDYETELHPPKRPLTTRGYALGYSREVTSLNGYHSRTTWNFHAGVQVIGPGRFRFAKYPFPKARHQRA
jgi:hypothetical protein